MDKGTSSSKSALMSIKKTKIALFDNWIYKWKLSFNPDPLKQGQELIFS